MTMASCSSDTETTLLGTAILQPRALVDPTVTTVHGQVATGIVQPVPTPSELSLRLTGGKFAKTWSSIDQYPADQPLNPGTYTAEVFYGSEYDEGFEKPYFYASENVSLTEGKITPLTLTAKLSNSIIAVEYTDGFRSAFSAAHATLHASGGGYIDYPATETRNVYLRASDLSVYLDVSMADGAQARFLAAKLDQTDAATLYTATIDATRSSETAPITVTVSFDEQISTDDQSVTLTDEFLNAQDPAVSPLGFTEGTPIVITEGSASAQSIGFSVEGAQASRLILTTQSRSLIEQGWPSEVDILNATPTMLQTMRNLGLQTSADASGRISTVDLQNVMSRIRTESRQTKATFSLLSETASGRISEPVSLTVDVNPADLTVVEINDLVIGSELARMEVIANGADLTGNLSIQATDASGRWQDCEIVSVTEPTGSSANTEILFRVPESQLPTTDIRIYYCGQLKAEQTVKRISPRYSIEVDPFAMIATLKITAEDPAELKTVTSLVNIYVDDVRTDLVSRDTEKGIITIGGLLPDRSYSLKTTLFTSASEETHFATTQSFTTESARPLENGGFDEVKTNELKIENLPSGGLYSQTIIDIFNQQNYWSMEASMPKTWANTNAKTFCKQATNKNTWYTLPSVYSDKDFFQDSYSVVIRTVAYDINGKAIPPYRQTGEPFLRYSLNIPRIAHRAAGKVFLGKYSFDPATQTEVYDEGVSFSSRPSALNGYYKFTPSSADLNDQGYVKIEVLGVIDGVETVISSADLRLRPATSYTAFSIPLQYSHFGVKANRLKVMVASSCHIGTIEEETASIKTYDDPVTATSLGGVLQVDGLQLSY